MNKKGYSDRNKTVFVLLLFALALLIVGAVLRSRIGTFVEYYTENQAKKQAETHALLMAEEFNAELENLEYIAGKLETSIDDMDELMPKIYNESGIKQGLLSIDGDALYGDSLDVSVFEGIQSSFRGEEAITFVEGEGLLFTCPVFYGPNIRYVLYRLCPTDSLEEHFATDIYDDLGKFCVTTRDSRIVVPFYNSSSEDMKWYKSDDIQKKYESMHREMEVSVAVARSFSTDRGDMLLFESEIRGTDFLISGFVPKVVASEGVGSLTLLVVWVFGLLMLLVMIGAFYLTRASIKIRESDELREAKAIAEEASRAKSDFLANMSHEIRTPLNSVLGMNEMILRESNDDAITTYASNVKTAGKSLLGIINDILDFSKIEAGKIDIIPVEYSVPSMINDLVNMIKTRADDKGLDLILDFDKNLPKGLYGDEVRIKQVITNLLTNSVKYTEKGSVTFAMRYEEAEDDPDSIMLKVEVKDTGIGIRSEDIEKMFVEFERIEEKRNRNIEGTGLGMSITKNLLEMMGSTLNVESVYGEGSAFGFSVKQKVIDRKPLGDYEATLKQQLESMEKYHEKFTAEHARVLVMDDNEMNLMVFKSLIKQTRVKIDTAQNGDEGIALARRTKYDMIFIDHMMPRKDGIETLTEIREKEDDLNRSTPAICLTANAISGAREKYISAGFDEYLAKPIDPDELENMMITYIPKEKIEMSVAGHEDIPDEKDDTLPEEIASFDPEIIDTDVGIKNSGSVSAYISLLKAFYEVIDEKTEELNRLFDEEDYKNYTIKVHALKSSARIIGAAGFGERAQRLENAGKAEDTGYIRNEHGPFMQQFGMFKDMLAPVAIDKSDDKDMPQAGKEMMADVYKEIKSAALEMDCDRLEAVFDRMDDYSIPESEKELFEKLKGASDRFEYKTIVELLDKGL